VYFGPVEKLALQMAFTHDIRQFDSDRDYRRSFNVDTIDTLRLFSDGRMSAHDARALLASMGHSREDFAEAFVALSGEAGSSIRVGAWQKEEWQAELFLTSKPSSSNG
jgi:hypothetical protein